MIGLLFAVCVDLANADWQVTVNNWTKSPGPNLAEEDVLLDGNSIDPATIVGGKCTDILPTDSNNCIFTVTDKANQNIQIRSTDTDANEAPLHVIGSLGTGPAPASGGSVTVIWQ